MSIIGVSVRGVVAALLVGAGWVCWTVGRTQARLADANSQMVMLQYAGSLREYDDIEQSLGYVWRFPASVTRMLADLGERRATALYWDKRYGALSLVRDASGALVETNPDILFLAANAAYRAGHRPDGERLAVVRAFDAAVANYADVLRKAPGHLDAAYNYEYAVRARDAAARGRETPRNRPGGAAQREQAPPAGGQPSAANDTSARRPDLPVGPTIHGRPGAPPADSDMQKFRMLVPMLPDERQGAPDKAGEGGRPVRRG